MNIALFDWQERDEPLRMREFGLNVGHLKLAIRIIDCRQSYEANQFQFEIGWVADVLEPIA